MNKKISAWLTYAFLLFLPTQLGKHFFPDYTNILGVRSDFLAPTLYVTDLIALALILFNLPVIIKFFKQRSVLLLLALMAINVVFATSLYPALYKSVKVIEILAIFAIIKSERLNPYLILLMLGIGSLVEVGIAISQFMLKQSIQGPLYFLGERYMTLSTPNIAKSAINGREFLRPYATFSHPNSMAGFYLAIYFFVLTYPPFSKHAIVKHATLLFCSMLIFISFSKAAIGTFIILNIVWLIKNRKQIDCMFCLVSRLVVLLVVSAVFLIAKGDTMTFDKRVMLADHAISIFLTNPLVGVGLGNYILAEAQYPNKYMYFFVQPVHNIFLLLLTEGGLVITIYALYKLYKWLEPRLSNPTIWYLTAVVLLTGMADHYWLTLQQNMLLLPALLTIATLQPKKLHRKAT